MADNQSQRGGTSQQHAEAGRQSHKNDEHNQSRQGGSGEGRGWHGDPEGHAEAGRKGGEAVSQDREHMAEIGRKGGEAVSEDREHMADIGRKGGEARGDNNDTNQSGRGSSQRGGTSEQHAKAGSQSHKND
jgi:general stress protein YciG